MSAKVVHCKKDSYDVYIGRGRGSKWGNPFTHLQHLGGDLIIVDSREEAISRYEEWLLTQPELIDAAKKELKDKILGCWCFPLACHGEILLKIANS